MTENAVYLVTEDVARRAGVLEVAYITKDGRFIMDIADFKRLRMTPEEYIIGIQGVERITEAEAKSLVIENQYRRLADVQKEAEAAEETQKEAAEPAEENAAEDSQEEVQEEVHEDSDDEEPENEDEQKEEEE